jgi:hypothetical protein
VPIAESSLFGGATSGNTATDLNEDFGGGAALGDGTLLGDGAALGGIRSEEPNGGATLGGGAALGSGGGATLGSPEPPAEHFGAATLTADLQQPAAFQGMQSHMAAVDSKPGFEEQLAELQDDDPTTFGSYDASGVIGAGTCMGGFIKDLDLYLDCRQLLGFLAIVNTEESHLDKLSKLREVSYLQDMGGPGGNGVFIANNSRLASTAGLAGLSLVAGAIVIEGNALLPAVSGLGDNLLQLGSNYEGQSVTIRNNAGLLDVGNWDLSGGVLPGGITVTENVLLQEITGMSSI